MPISQCPRCELKFTSVSEMRWHLREDHPRERQIDSTPLTVPVQRSRGPNADDPAEDDTALVPARGSRTARWWRRRTRSDRA
ncbi:hypothetical protein [Pseudonocardia broussonetiae]|uniref:C2H2-type domain-containing protein n=1 Tax=Pseudonocardia broussonetiae TaxID=2736640 RepID=A0A6M6JSS0_9PSEU|nr:hypothetical protein [Pseudonocardia broussonetiae]QJY51144.1 hypothetical protein HOP40_34750 [Pseudonocardia broussonetiae]